MRDPSARPTLSLSPAAAQKLAARNAEWICKPCGSRFKLPAKVAEDTAVRCPSCGANLGVTSGAEAVELAVEPLESRGIIVVENGRLRVRERNVLRYYARSLDHLLASPSRHTH